MAEESPILTDLLLLAQSVSERRAANGDSAEIVMVEEADPKG